MLDHIGLRTTQLDVLVRFYERVLAPLGYKKLYSFGEAAGFGREGAAPLWIHAAKTKPTGIHLALSATDRVAVDNFYGAALDAGAAGNGEPGLRTDYHTNYYAAFVTDPDGNNLEMVCHAAA